MEIKLSLIIQLEQSYNFILESLSLITMVAVSPPLYLLQDPEQLLFCPTTPLSLERGGGAILEIFNFIDTEWIIILHSPFHRSADED